MLFSIIVPFRNAESFLPAALQSLSTQLLGDFEAVLVDDGSSDGSALLAKQQVSRDWRFKLLLSEAYGVSSARNRGLDVAAGDYVLFLDADDQLPNFALEKISTLVKPGFPDVLMYGFNVFKAGNLRASHTEAPAEAQRQGANQIFNHGLPPRMIPSTSPAVWNKAFRRDFIEEHSLRFWPDLVEGTEDLHFSYRALILANHLVLTQSKLYSYTASVANSLSSRPAAQCMESITAVMEVLTTESLSRKWKRALYEQLGRFLLRSFYLSPRLETLTIIQSRFETSGLRAKNTIMPPLVVALMAILLALAKGPSRLFHERCGSASKG